MTRLSRKQYILSSHRLVIDDMHEYELSPEKFLYVDDLLNIARFDNGMILLGNAFCMDSIKTVTDDIIAWHGSDVRELVRYWTGRWVLITIDEFITDACGLMSAFYSVKDNEWCISSSLALLDSLGIIKIDGSLDGSRLDWQLLPLTISSNMRKLLSLEKIVFNGKSINIVPNNWITDYTHLSSNEKCEKLAEYLTNTAKNIGNTNKNIYVALTAGKDSRLVLAAFLAANVKIDTFLYQHPKSQDCNKKTSSEIASDFSLDYHYITRDSFSQERVDDYKNFTGGNTLGADLDFYAYDQFSKIPPESYVIRGGLFEAGQTYARSITKPDAEGFKNGMRFFYKSLTTNKLQNKALDEWIDITSNNKCDFIDLRDRFYIEQRVGGWVAAIEQSFDLTDFTSIQIANCADLLSILLAADDEERAKLTLAFGSIQLLEPQLMKYPINAKSLKDRIIGECVKIKHSLISFKSEFYQAKKK